MKFLFDLFPVILFFIAFKFAGIYTATAVAIGATVVQIALTYLKHRKVDAMQWASLGIIVFFGGATLFFHNENFIKWKPTVLYWLFASVLLISATIAKKNLIQSAMSAQVSLAPALWSKLNFAWVIFFSCMGCLNLYIAFNYDTPTWVNFKLFGGMGLLIAFVLAQGVWLSRHIEEPKQ